MFNRKIHWEGIAYYYHLAIGWEDGIWEIQNIKSVLTDFQSLSTSSFRFPETPEVLDSICELLESAIKENQKVWIEKD